MPCLNNRIEKPQGLLTLYLLILYLNYLKIYETIQNFKPLKLKKHRKVI